MLGIFLLIEWSIRHDARCKVSLRIVVLLVVVNFLQGFFTNYWNPPFHRTIFQMFLFQPLFNHPSWSQLSALVPHFCTAFTKAVPASHWNSKKLFYKPGSFFEDSVQIQLVRVSFILNNGVTDTNLLRRPPEQGVLRPVYSSNHAFIFKNYSLSACSMLFNFSTELTHLSSNNNHLSHSLVGFGSSAPYAESAEFHAQAIVSKVEGEMKNRSNLARME